MSEEHPARSLQPPTLRDVLGQAGNEESIETGEVTAEAELSRRVTEIAPGAEAHIKRATLVSPDDRPPVSRGADTYLGCLIDGRYLIEGILGEGGMGVVYSARHQVIDKQVAIKILLQHMAADEEVTERFVTEARAASAIGHEHIVDVHDFGRLPDGSTYFVMEYLDGSTLGQIARADAPLEMTLLLDYALQLTEALSAAHAAGIVHRDLKPDNIFIIATKERERFVKVLDFGIAKVARGQNKLTRAGTIFGTPHYMSPEQAAGTEADERSDIYSLGVILYELAAGQVPFDAENPMGLMTQHMFRAPTPPSQRETPVDVAAGLEAVLIRCLAKSPDDRYSSMSEFREDLRLLEQGQLPAAVGQIIAQPDAYGAEKPWLSRLRALDGAPGRRNRVLWIGAPLLVGAGLGFAILGSDSSSPTPPTPSAVTTVAQPAASTPRVTAEPVPLSRVAIIVSPIDAEIFVDGVSQGQMPVTVMVRRGQKRQVKLQREGFRTEIIEIDGTESRLAKELGRIPGVEPVPAPVADIGELLDGGLFDAGTPEKIVDAGAAPPPESDAQAPAVASDAAAPAAPTPAPDAAPSGSESGPDPADAALGPPPPPAPSGGESSPPEGEQGEPGAPE